MGVISRAHWAWVAQVGYATEESVGALCAKEDELSAKTTGWVEKQAKKVAEAAVANYHPNYLPQGMDYIMSTYLNMLQGIINVGE
jgi:hypothetical protein